MLQAAWKRRALRYHLEAVDEMWSVKLFITTMGLTKTAEPTEMTFGVWTRVGQEPRIT